MSNRKAAYLNDSQTTIKIEDRSEVTQIIGRSEVDARKYFYCAECDYKTTLNRAMKTHKRKKHASGIKTECVITIEKDNKGKQKCKIAERKDCFACSHCDFRSEFKIVMNRHRKFHEKQTLIFACEK